ncbi:IclR family transcriptional regulator C-terminal domain-containing protein [Streptomyces sp. NPDC059740]|uniref:IclR family transcriptional regulator domain-containing protein n=1 Tax=Streptomyces sp. NPDC059740 TaxID=3346926 RepID=UPI00364D869A
MPPVPDDAAAPAAPRETVGPLVRGLAVLRALTAAGGRSTLGDLARSTALARSTVDRVAGTLHRVGHVHLSGREVTLAPRLMELGNAYLVSSGLAALGELTAELADSLDESVSVAVPDGDGVRFVRQTTRRRAMSLTFRIGDLLPAERGAPGALFAADWTAQDWSRWQARHEADPRDDAFPAVPAGRGDAGQTYPDRVAAARTSGYALDDQLIEPGLVAVAVPVHDAEGRAVCALSAVSHTRRHSAHSLRDAALPRLRATAARMAEVLRAPRPDAGAPDAGARAPWARSVKQELGPTFLESLARGLSVLAAFDADAEALPLTAVAERTGLARATARRALITLEHLGYVTAGDGRFRPTPRVLDLGFAHLSGLTLADIAQPHLAALVERVHESASVSVLRGDQIQYVARVPTVRIMSVNITVGTRFPAYATSMGRALLAGLPEEERTAHLPAEGLAPLTPYTVTDPARLAGLLAEVRAQGYAMVDNELEEGLRSLAVPVRDASGRPVAAVNVSTHSSSSTAEGSRERLLPHLRAAAEAVESDLRVAGRCTRVATG